MLHEKCGDIRGGIPFVQLPEMCAIFQHSFAIVAKGSLQTSAGPIWNDLGPDDGEGMISLLDERHNAWRFLRLAPRDFQDGDAAQKL